MRSKITAQEIKRIRCTYGLTQQSFALLLGIGEASIVRYESGSTPTKANENLIRAAANPEFMLERLDHDGNLLSEPQRSIAQEYVFSLLIFDREGMPMSTNDLYMILLQQEVLNEYAAEAMADVTRLLQEAEQEGDHARVTVLEDVLCYLSNVGYRITESQQNTRIDLATIRGQIDAARHIAFLQKAKAA